MLSITANVQYKMAIADLIIRPQEECYQSPCSWDALYTMSGSTALQKRDSALQKT